MRAILIDDEPLSLEGMERLLRRYGVEVAAAYLDPAEALAGGPGVGADVAFVDIEMPGMNGLEAAARLMSDMPDLAVVFVTAYDQYAISAFELNATDYLLKPVQPKRLEATLARIAERMRLRRAWERPQQMMFRCFLRLSVTEGDGTDRDVQWRTSKAKELFAYLLHMRNKPVPKDVLIDLIWPDLDLGRAQTHLHTTVYQIRQTLKAAGLPIKLNYADGGYRLDLNGAGVDVDLFEQRLSAWERGESPSGDGMNLWRELYRGDYFELEGYLWAEPERERMRNRWHAGAMRAAAGLGGTPERIGEAQALLMEIIARFPTSPDGYLQLIKLLHAQGRGHEGRKLYEQYRQALLEESGEEPSGEIAAWYHANH